MVVSGTVVLYSTLYYGPGQVRLRTVVLSVLRKFQSLEGKTVVNVSTVDGLNKSLARWIGLNLIRMDVANREGANDIFSAYLAHKAPFFARWSQACMSATG